MTSIRIEAEDMNLTNYVVESGKSPASGNELITLLRTGSTIGNASINFTGATGRYQVKLGYFDENDGLATLDIQIGNHTSSLNLDQNLGHGGVSSRNFVEAEIFKNLEITTGETITITGVAEAAEWARVDYIEFIPLIEVPSSLGSIAFSDPNFTVNEDGTTTSTVTLVRTGDSSGEVGVTLNLSNGTASSNDYNNNSIPVTFADGETIQTINIPIIDDDRREDNETINLSLTNPTSGVTLGSQDTATLTIIDNDSSLGQPIRIEAEDMNLTNYVVESGKSPASGNELITLLRTGYTIGNASINFTGATGRYQVKLGYFDENDGLATLDIQIGNHTSSLNLDQNLGHGGVSSRNFVEAEIFKNLEITTGETITITGVAEAAEWARVDYIEFIPLIEVPSSLGSIAFSDPNFTVNEDGTTTSTVTLVRTGDSSGEVGVTLNLSNGTASSNDYNNNSIPVTFADGETIQTINIPIIDDDRREDNETINLSLTNPTSGVTLGSQDTATLTIIDNDSSLGQPIRIEAEDMNLTNYVVESGKSPASGNELITLLRTGYTIGNASINFTGATGRYQVKLGYFDENDGLATLDIQIGNHTSSLNLDQNLGHGGVSSRNFVEAEIFKNLEITTGETITITGVAEAAEWARVDYIEFIPLIDSSEPPISQSPTNGNDLLEGNSENNTINALDGNDIIKPGAGNNTINGGSGVDTISYDYDTAGVNVDLSNGIAVRKFTTTSDREFKILPLGDSNTRGYPNKNDIGGYRTNLWTGLTVDNNFNVNFVGSAASGPSFIDRDHEGRGAFTIDELTDNVNGKIGFNNSGAPIYTNIENALSDSPDMVLLMAGTNDLKNQGDTVNNALNELGTLVDRITVALPNTQVLVASILPNYANAETTTKVEEFNSRIEDEVVNPRIANSDNVSFVDVFNSPLTTSDFDPDGTHLTQTGYDKVADVFLDAVLETKGGEDSLSDIENIIGSAYDDTLTGNAGSNIIDGGRGDDLLTGGAGSDTFVLSSQGDTDTILDFEVGQDLFNLDSGLTFADLTITQGSTASQNDSWISLTDNSEILAILNNIDSSLISASDFV